MLILTLFFAVILTFGQNNNVSSAKVNYLVEQKIIIRVHFKMEKGLFFEIRT